VAGVLAYALVLGPLLDRIATASFGVRLALGLTLLVALGMPMGMPFPLALRALRASSDALVPWAIGVNGFASVVASAIAVPIALLGGLRVLIALGAVAYLGALVTRPVPRSGM